MKTRRSARSFLAGLVASATLAGTLLLGGPPPEAATRFAGSGALAPSLASETPTPSPNPPEPSPSPRAAPTAKPTPEPLEVRAARAEAKADACGSAACRRAALEPIFREAWTASASSEDHAVRRVIPCESEPDWYRRSVGAAGELGLLQLHPKYHRWRWAREGWSDEDMFRVVPNATIGQEIFDESGWGPWTCG